MNNRTIKEIFKKFGVKSRTMEVETVSLKRVYSQMVADVKDEPMSILSYKELFKEVFEADKEKLVIEGSNIYFVYDDQTLTNFGAVVLDIIHLHEIERVRYEVQLLILSQHDKPKTVNINSLELRSSRWIEDLGVSYRYEMVRSIQNAIKIMAQFAPEIKNYTYSGWATDKPDTYIWGGKEICTKI